MRRLLPLVLIAAFWLAACSEEAPASTTTDGPVFTTAPSTTSGGTTTSTSGTSEPPSTSSSIAPTTTTTIPLADVALELEEIGSGFGQPVLLLSPPGDERIFVVDQPGRVFVIDGDAPEVYLDIRDEVRFQGERGLLGLAFAPDFATSGDVYVHYTGSGGATVVSRFASEPSANAADAASEQVLLRLDQPASNHNGGMIAFGPDGNLYVALGDGGGADDRFGQGQRADTLLAAILRITPTEDGYEIPADNPFAGGGDGAAEVWAYGLRNPWRFAIDGNDVYIADVGQNRIEEVNVVPLDPVPGALNFGWPIQEGTDCFSRSNCDPSGLVQPAIEYTHSRGCSITGGFVYRGSAIPSLQGHYFYGDYCDGWISSVAVADGVAGPEFEWFEPGTANRLTSFGIDSSGEIYVLQQNGTISRIVAAG